MEGKKKKERKEDMNNCHLLEGKFTITVFI